jgi:dTDP-4-amino-4,6-dideoxygalactose transaminase
MGPEERELLLEAFDSNWIAPLGPNVDGFETEMCARLGVGHAAALSSGTAALHLALLNLGVQPGDSVLCASLTFSATANAITYCGAVPVFVDVEEDSWCIDPDLVASELEKTSRSGVKPAAVISVDLYGDCCDYEALRSVCDRHGVPLIEDAAEALGSVYQGKPAGSLGDMSILSFNGNKIITTSGGGMLLSNRKDWIDHARFLATQARDPAPHYQHSHIGYNYRMSNLLAAVGRGQLSHLDERVARRREINRTYRERLGTLPGVRFLPEPPGTQSNCWLTVLLLDPSQAKTTPESLRLALDQENIEARPVWKPMHLQPAFQSARFLGPGHSERLFHQGLCLPSGSSMTPEDHERVLGVLEKHLIP